MTGEKYNKSRLISDTMSTSKIQIVNTILNQNKNIHAYDVKSHD